MIWIMFLLLIILLIALLLLFYLRSHHIKEINNLKIFYAEKLKYLNQITQSLQSTLQLDKVLLRILDILSNRFGYKPIFIYLIDESRNSLYLQCIASPGIVSLKGIGIYSFSIDSKEKHPLYHLIQNKTIALNFRSQEISDKIRIPEVSILPITVRDRVIGLMVTKRISERQDLLPLTIFIGQMGLSIENAQLFEKTQELSITDTLTGVYNRRYFDRHLPEELELARRYKSYLSLGMIDIDDFKHYNDTNGHLLGDECLKLVAKLLTTTVRSGDTIARYGGEEFAVILPAIDKSGAFIACEKIRKTVESYPFECGQKQPLGKVTISIGIATFPVDAQDHHILINQADKALYRAKTTGKNKVITI